MEARLIDIGTSKGIRIPLSILKNFHTPPEAFEMTVNDHQIILNIKENPRSGWEKKFRRYDDEMLIDDALEIEKLDEL